MEPARHLSAHLEGRDYLLGHRDCRAIARISSGPCAAPLGHERAEAAQLNPLTPLQCGCDGVEDRVDDVLHILLIQVRVLFSELLNQFGFDHRSLERSTRTGQTKGPPNAGRGGVEMPAESAGSSTLPRPSPAATARPTSVPLKPQTCRAGPFQISITTL